MTSAIKSFGTKLQIGTGNPVTYNTIAEVQDIDGPSIELGTEEVTSHDSPDGWKEYIGTLKDGGEISFDVNLIPSGTTHEALQTALTGAAVMPFKLILPDSNNSTYEFSALVTGFQIGAPVEGKLSASITLKITGEVTLPS